MLVTPSGRVVILDFGLAVELEESSDVGDRDSSIVGTIPYMSPEQAAGETLTEASDWYAVGAMLYEALTGQYPFHDAGLKITRLKQQHEPPPPLSLVPQIPADLNDLCVALLRRHAGDRPTGLQIFQRLARR